MPDSMPQMTSPIAGRTGQPAGGIPGLDLYGRRILKNLLNILTWEEE